MLQTIIPKLPMRDKQITKSYYINELGFSEHGDMHYDFYLMLKRDDLEIHFFEFKELDTKENYGQVYIRVHDIASFYHSLLNNRVAIHPNGKLETKPWGQREFSLIDPDSNLLTFGEGI